MSTIAVNAITDASGGNTASINGATPTTDNLMGRNRIINGDMRIDQRATSVTSANWTVDRFYYNTGTASKGTAAISTNAPTGFTNSLGFTSSSAYSVAAGDYFGFQQPIEGLNISDLAWGSASAKTVTLSFWVRSSLTGTFGGSLRNSGAARSYVFSYTISAADTWEYKTVTIPGDTSGTWLTTNGVGIFVHMTLASGSNNLGTAGSWSGSNLIGPTGQTSVVGTSGATFYITGVQLEAGSVATSFERRSYGQELALCQRYCFAWRTDSLGYTQYGRFPPAFVTSATSCNTDLFLPQPMRTTAYSLTYNNKAFSEYFLTGGGANGSSITLNTDANATNWVNVVFTVSGSSLPGSSIVGIRFNNATDAALIISTEL